MPIPLAAAITLLVSAGFLVGAYLAAAAGRIALALACVVTTGALVRGYAASEHQLHEWDERFHAVVAMHLIQHPLTPTLYDDPVLPYDYRDWMANHVWLHKPPVTLWLMAGSLRLFGTSELAARLPSVALSTLTILLTFAIGRRLFDTRVALLAAGFHTVNGFLVALVSGRATSDHVDTVFIALFELGVFIAILEMERDRLSTRIALGVTLGLALLTKWYPACLILAPWLYLSLTRRAIQRAAVDGLVIITVAAAVAAPWTWYIARAFPREAVWEWRYGLQHIGSELEGHHLGPWFFLVEMPKFFGELVYLPIVWAAIMAVRRASVSLRLLSLWVAVPYLVFSVAATKGSSYVMVAAPAVFLTEAWFWWEVVDCSVFDRQRVLRAALLLVLGFLPGRYLLRPGGPFTIADRQPQWVASIESLRGYPWPPRPLLFNVPHPIEAMFYLPFPAYRQMPSADQAVALSAQGYSVLVFEERTATVQPYATAAPR
jgi:hypothetical protein